MTPTLQRVFLKELKQAWLMNAFQAEGIIKFGSKGFPKGKTQKMAAAPQFT
jgi:hypothetical protein